MCARVVQLWLVASIFLLYQYTYMKRLYVCSNLSCILSLINKILLLPFSKKNLIITNQIKIKKKQSQIGMSASSGEVGV